MVSIRKLHEQLVKKERSAVEITQETLDRIQAVEPDVNSFLHITADKALKQAQQVDAKIAAGEEIGMLAGIPIAIKDNMCTKGITTTCGSKILENFVPPYESTVTQKLAEAGAVLVGKTNLDEFAMGSSTENSAYKLTNNPWDVSRVPGGSSGGSAAAVAAGECTVSLGSDTGGSIRQPASFCGVIGMKPTYGLVSRYGLVAYASSLDQIGPFSRNVEDSAILLSHIAGYDPKDSTSLKVDIPDYAANFKPDLKRRGQVRIGIIKETFGEGIDSQVEKAVTKAIEQLQNLGAEIHVISCPNFRYGIASYYIIAPSEASANLARYDGVKYGLRDEEAESLISMYNRTRAHGFGQEVKRRIMIGTYTLSAGYYDAYYLKAQKFRTLIKEDFEKAFRQVDVLVCPTVPMTAFKAGEKDDPLSMYLTDLMTIPVNLAGLPGISIPCGFDDNGLPVGLQMIGRVLGEEQLFQIAYAYEQSTDWHLRTPKI
ncbi:Asp-tRNA(Asn)/Glu-tRNA(Gln) amidotransferase subunit GatA [Mastigocoleus testarum]|uniref:Glutamyl-tRNA(Gln) amidotransferase subunit A n=1 Tax=Mastigocoleus testarum BC008 TaxID=371196 RepID=A0A0V7ZV87_9CYAN|nr:Asp-tRNA(Asn)/Glu-tRNA(Gln) amidotransferase subunit GatA [Mastigocoleus testarum]KST68095.1 glutamyl-tRNA amidotransferase [Mastigocoleus testarum BC008]KST68102.1 glutamyl-tRNA amidotransferase [Mastigocoleus testarum BC008]